MSDLYSVVLELATSRGLISFLSLNKSIIFNSVVVTWSESAADNFY